MTGYEWDFPPLRHSLGTRATFSPLTCLIAAHPLDRATERARIASGSLVDGLGGNVAYYHELFHWVQFQASTLGQFLLTLRHARDQLVYQSALEDPAFRDTLFDPKRKSPVIAYETAGEPDPRFSCSTHERLDRYRDVEVVRRLFYRPHMVGYELYPFAVAVERALEHVGALEQESGYGAGRPDRSFRVTTGEAVDFATSTESILELSALAMELLMHLTAREIDIDLLQYVLNRIQDEIREVRASALACVGGALLDELLKMAQSGDGTALYDTVTKIAIICDVALNPPLPPVCEVADTIALDDVLPTSRFARLLAVAQLGGSGDEFHLSPDTVTRYRDRIARDSGLTYAGPDPSHTTRPYPSLPDTKDLPRFHWLFLRATSARFFALRREFPELLVFFGPLFSGYRSEQFTDAIELNDEKWFLPPAFEAPDGIKPCAAVETAKAFIQSLAADFSMNDFVARPELLSLPHFPKSARAELIGAVQDWVTRLRVHCG
ncbi:MAG: hypothetical protein LW699_08215 [Pirellula sp.]|jgi:hypothetical protein|nr:hypothetical protein [Pirellula sp.]